MKIISCLLLFIQVISNKVLPTTPKAQGLSNHHGTVPSKNFYGPEREDGIKRVGDQTLIKLNIVNYEKEIVINSDSIKAGKLKNISYDAGRIITPQIAGKIVYI